jgi:hypothetical protein
MNDYIKVNTTIEVERSCANCLYCGSNGIHCGNANNYNRPMLFINAGRACNYFWLDQHRFPNAESRW